MITEAMTNSEYHGETTAVSSSQLKTMLEDPELFYRKYITKEIAREESSVFDVGTFFHTAILEPEKMSDECAVFGGIRRGKEWEAFKEANAKKTIITKAEHEQAKALVNAVLASPIAVSIVKSGKAEVSCFVDLIVYQGEVYYHTETMSFFCLTLRGWEPAAAIGGGVKIRVKVRADLLADNYVLDLKSTTGNVKSPFTIAQKVSNYSYDLSAALYLDVFEASTNKKREFVWTFASKDYGNCRNYVASESNIRVGRQKWKKAIVLLAKYIDNEWTFSDEMEYLEPQHYEKSWIKEEDGIL